MIHKSCNAGTFSGRTITSGELETIRETVALFSSLSRTELAHTICEHLDWHTPSGTNKWDACSAMLEKFEEKGLISLPRQNKRLPRRPTPARISGQTDPGPPLEARLSQMPPVYLFPAHSRSQIRLWNEYVQRYHYLGYKKPFGYRLRYFIRSGDQNLGCLLFAGAARALADRDRWIGWNPARRRTNITFVTNNTRFLIFPWVKIKNLASHALALAARRICQDWEELWGFSPVLIETFVDPDHYKGTCYLAANWHYLGTTTGKGLARKGCAYETRPKKIFAYPLTPCFKEILCRNFDQGA